MKHHNKKAALALLMAAICCLMLGMAAQAEEAGPYGAVLSGWTDVPMAGESIEVSIFDYEAQDVGLTTEEIGGEQALCWRTGNGEVTFRVTVPQTGLYGLSLRYAQLESNSTQVERGVKINGAYPYEDAHNFLLPKRFTDEQYPFKKNEYGNDIRPNQVGVMTPGSILLRDREGMYAEPVLFRLEQGENTVTLIGVKGSVAILGLTLTAPEATPEYAAYTAAHGQDKPSAVVTVEAEQIAERTSKSIQNLTFSNPSVSPAEPGSKLFNAIGGSSWHSAGDSITWRFEVPESGWYSLSFAYLQNFNTSLTSYRRIEVDGKVPFAEFEVVGFPFRSNWSQLTPEQQVWLEAGEHTLTLTAVCVPYLAVYTRLNTLVNRLKALDLNTTEIIGSDSDVYRIWKLEKYIPTIKEDLEDMVVELNGVCDMLHGILGDEVSLGTLDNEIEALGKLAANHNLIAKRADALSEIYTVLADWLDNMRSQPLALDRVFIVGAGSQVPVAAAGALEGLTYQTTSFVRSFFGSGDDTSTAHKDNTVTVWVQRNRDYVDMMQQLADEHFTPATGIKVQVSYCPPGTQLLVLANAAGNQPDVVCGTDIALPFEFGVRNALVDLSKLDGFDELVANVPVGSRIPNYFSGAEYGIAEEIRVKVMFYRTDVMNSLGLAIPTTWNEMTQVLSTLLQHNDSFYYPYGDYLTFFFQNDVDVYTDDGLALAFTNEKGFAAYRLWTELYVKYGLQPQMSSFYQHFRLGDVPIGIADIDQYIQFDMAAPDISGDWTIAMVPGTYAEDGVLQRWQGGTQTDAVMFRTNAKREQNAWEFMKWWLNTDTQLLFAESMENNYGEEFRWYSANTAVIAQQDWSPEAKQVLLDQMKWYKQLPMVPGGSYMTSRELWNAWTRIVVDDGNYREEIEEAIEDIELEISIKQQEMGFIDEDGKPLIPMSIMKIGRPDLD